MYGRGEGCIKENGFDQSMLYACVEISHRIPLMCTINTC
jgi:hypothetical protein